MQQQVLIVMFSFDIGLDKQIFVGKYPVAVKCTHTVFPFVRLVTSMNKSVHLEVSNILEIGRNRKQYLNNVCICLHFLQQ